MTAPMDCWRGLGRATALTAVFLWGTVALTQEKGQAEAEPGHAALFNGKDLAGWDGDARVWSVREGVIRGDSAGAGTGRHTALVWRGAELHSFALTFEFRLVSGTAAIQYRASPADRQPATGYRFGISAEAGTTGCLWREADKAPLAGAGEFVVGTEGGRETGEGVITREALQKVGYCRAGEWNTGKVLARGNDIVQFVNGRQVSELVDNDAGRRAASGRLALWLPGEPGSSVEFREIRLKRFDSSFGEAIFLFNGKDLDGWSLSSDSLKATWGVNDGIMTNSGQPGGYIRTTADYTNYLLRLQFRHLTAGNGGILLRITGPDRVWPRCVEAQGMRGSVADIFGIGDFPMSLDPVRARGRYSPKLHPSNEGELGEWSQYDITFDAGSLELRVNDLLQNLATDCWETPGKIGLQSEGGRMEFRRLLLVPIQRPPATALVLDNGVLQARYESAAGTLTVVGGYRALLRDVQLARQSGTLPKATVVPVAGALSPGKALEFRHADGQVEQLAVLDRLPHAFAWSTPADPSRCVLGLCATDGGDPGVVPLDALGLPKDAICAGFDRSGDRFFGPVRGAVSLALSGAAGRVVCVQAVGTDRPVVLDTSDGPAALVTGLGWDAAAKVLAGKTRVAAARPYQLRLFAPPRPLAWVAKAATVSGADTAAGVKVELEQTRQWLRVEIRSPAAREVDWQVAFATEPPREPEKPQIALTAAAVSPWSVRLSYDDGGNAVRLVRDAKTELPPGGSPVVDDTVNPDTNYTYSIIVPTWHGEDVLAGTATVRTPAPPPLPPAPDVYLSDLIPVKAGVGWGGRPRHDRSIEDNPIRIRRHRFDKGVGVHAVSELVYAIAPEYERFIAIVGVDDEKNAGSVTFQVYADEKLLFQTGKLTVADDRVDISVALPAGAKQLRLVVGDGGDGIGCDHADWAYAGFARKKN